jgi:hypothetical protein
MTFCKNCQTALPYLQFAEKVLIGRHSEKKWRPALRDKRFHVNCLHLSAKKLTYHGQKYSVDGGTGRDYCDVGFLYRNEAD